MMPADSEALLPWISRDMTSRPTSSVPIQCADVGGFRTVSQLDTFGSYGASKGAATAMAMNSSTIRAPAMAVGLRRNWRQTLDRDQPVRAAGAVVTALDMLMMAPSLRREAAGSAGSTACPPAGSSG